MGDRPRKKNVKKVVILVSLLVLAVTGIAAVKVVPPIIFHQRVQDGLIATLKTHVDVGDAEISLDRTSGYVRNIRVHNPPGFKSELFMEIQEITFKVDSDSIGSDRIRFKYITLHAAVLHLETKGEGSNLRDMITLMYQPTEGPSPAVRIDTLTIPGGTIKAILEYNDGPSVVSDFPLNRITNLEGTADELAAQFTLELQKEMDAQVKEAAKAINIDIFQSFKNMFSKE